MNSEEYALYGFYRTLDSYLSEWQAHNFAYGIDVFGFLHIHTKNVIFDKDEFTIYFKE